MPLPTSGEQWPPAPMKAVYGEIAANDTWLSGSTEAQTQLVSGVSAGIVNSVKRRLGWNSTGSTSQTVHVPVAASISRMSAAILFGEMFTATFTDDNDADDNASGQVPADVYEALTKRVGELLNDHAQSALMEGAEFGSAHGGVYYRVSWDKEVEPNGAFITVRAADTAVPTFRFGRLVNVQFWDRLDDIANLHYILLEMHERGTISFGLYESPANGTLGSQVDLRSHPGTAHLAALDGGNLVGKTMTIPTGTDRLTAVFMPNAKPARSLRKDAVGSQMGRSDYDEAGDLFAMLDETMTSWERDFRLGKTRVMVPRNMLKLGAPGTGGSFDTDQELFVQTENVQVGAMNEPGATSAFQVIQPNIRTDDHQKTVEYLFDRIYTATGYSAQSFGEDGNLAKTATEVSAKEKMTLLTRAMKVTIARPVMADLVCALLDVDHFVFPDRGVDRRGLDPVIDFPDVVGEDPQTQAQTFSALKAAEAISIRTMVAERNPEWDEPAIDAEVARIYRENQINEPAPVDLDPLDPETDAVVPSAPTDAPAGLTGEVN